ncbi:ParB/Srx family N-terminal domain-containing protein [Mycobacterium sp. CVI_P3]|uniref:ParB/Srx family N-terminal domain-containing protein n=1 Tax=Mycobacterium pinniadriaticum TaxID=2994102 RepID=A0ABT3SCP2_9MYCO|nr:ParB/Srx family N-terminal domain-containing protein [Mycobacterium pinniadriaticum]MCX2930485.1 ParB/Srx family N-terminal domain-containing protein [Mycobacterium pinniadriaticum]MCX2936909.1 ParB/Srx family N-terminal domain-containing protein [Mycobacterium pinniadriaticum]
MRIAVVCAAGAVIAAAVAPVPVAGADPGALACAPANQRYCAAQAGDLVETSLVELHPTQPSLGYDEVFYKLGRYTAGKDKINKKFADWCEANGQGDVESAKPDATLADPASFTCSVPLGAETPETIAPMKTAVVGPAGQLYLTDGHHTFTSFWEVPGGGPDTHVRVKITGNLSDMAPEAFWDMMRANAWTWLEDAAGNPVTPEQLPASLGLSQFQNDIYRGVLYFVRDVGYTQDENSPAFQEFYWGQWLRGQSQPALRPADTDLSAEEPYLNLVRNIAAAIVALPGDADVARGRTADDLGKLDKVDEEAFQELAVPYSGKKPGKLAYALLYKNSH